MRQTILLAAACPSTDVHGARLMKTLRSQNPNKEFRFCGIGGPEMAREGLEGIGVDCYSFIYKPFFPTKNFIRNSGFTSTDMVIHPAHMYKRYINWRILKKLEPKLMDVVGLGVSAIVTFENEFFMQGFYERIHKAYQTSQIICPPTFYSGLSHSKQEHSAQNYLDHYFSRIPLRAVNFQRFVFPHSQVGWDGVYRAYRYLFENNSKYKSLTDQDNILYLPSDEEFHFGDFIADLVAQQRESFRKDNNISEQDLVIFVAPGNSDKEIPWAIQLAQKGISKFLQLDEMKNVAKESITVVISVPEFQQYKDLAQRSIQKLTWPVRVIQVSNEESKFFAMTGSDIGIAVNGQIIAECAALQLPTMALDCKPALQSYVTQLWNSFDLDLNVAANGYVYPQHKILIYSFLSELLMQSIPNKVAYTLLEHYSDPKLRYYYIQRYSQILRNSLYKLNQAVPPQIQAQYPETNLVPVEASYSVMARQIELAAEKYNSLPSVQEGPHDQTETRLRILKELGWAKGM